MDTVDPFAQLAAKAAAPSDRVLNALREEVRDDTKPRQSLSRAKRTWFSVLALALGFTLTTVKIVGHSPTAFVMALAACSLSIGALLFSGVIPGNGSTSVGTRRSLLGVLAVVTFTVLALKADYFMPLGQLTQGEHITRIAHCGVYSLMAGVIASSGVMIIWRRTDPFSPGLTGALIGFLGGLIGTVSVSLSCRADEGIHLTLGHGIATVLVAALCWFWGRKWLAP